MKTKLITEVRRSEWAVHSERGRPSEHSVFLTKAYMCINCANKNKNCKKKKSYFPYCLSMGGTILPLCFYITFMFCPPLNKAFPDDLI